MMPNKFVFAFILEDEDVEDGSNDKEIAYRFFINGDEAKMKQIAEQFGEGELDIVADLEAEYGVHDVSMRPHEEFMGFSTYEVPEDKVTELMNRWRDWFISQGLTATEVSRLSDEEYAERFGEDDD